MRSTATTKSLLDKRSALMSKRNNKPLSATEQLLLVAVTRELDVRHAKA